MAFEQYIPSRHFVKHLAGAERQRARGRCSSADQHARGAAGLEGAEESARGVGIGRGSAGTVAGWRGRRRQRDWMGGGSCERARESPARGTGRSK